MVNDINHLTFNNHESNFDSINTYHLSNHLLSTNYLKRNRLQKIKIGLIFALCIFLVFFTGFLIGYKFKFSDQIFSKSFKNNSVNYDFHKFCVSQYFNSFLDTYKKEYSNEEEYTQRFYNFEVNLKKIFDHNSNPSKSFKMELNKFGDMSFEEFSDIYLSNIDNIHFKKSFDDLSNEVPNDYEELTYILYYTDNPEEFDLKRADLREKNIIPPVRDQQQCGSCWAFSAIGAFETSYLLKHPEVSKIHFSEQELVDCLGYDGCNGGLPIVGMDYIIERGISAEEDYSYKGNYSMSCKANLKNKSNRYFLKGKYELKPNSPFELKIASSVVAVSVGVCASESWMFYKSGVLDEICRVQLNHAVLVVGFDSEGQFDESSNTTMPYHIVKNSWGESWGDDGYIKIAMHQKIISFYQSSGIYVNPIIALASKN